MDKQTAVVDYSNVPLNPKEARMEAEYEEEGYDPDELEVPTTKDLSIC